MNIESEIQSLYSKSNTGIHDAARNLEIVMSYCPLPRCANNPIPRSLPWLDLRRKGPALV